MSKLIKKNFQNELLYNKGFFCFPNFVPNMYMYYGHYSVIQFPQYFYLLQNLPSKTNLKHKKIENSIQIPQQAMTPFYNRKACKETSNKIIKNNKIEENMITQYLVSHFIL